MSSQIYTIVPKFFEPRRHAFDFGPFDFGFRIWDFGLVRSWSFGLGSYGLEPVQRNTKIFFLNHEGAHKATRGIFFVPLAAWCLRNATRCWALYNLTTYEDKTSLQPNLPFRLMQHGWAGRKRPVQSSVVVAL